MLVNFVFDILLKQFSLLQFQHTFIEINSRNNQVVNPNETPPFQSPKSKKNWVRIIENKNANQKV